MCKQDTSQGTVCSQHTRRSVVHWRRLIEQSCYSGESFLQEHRSEVCIGFGRATFVQLPLAQPSLLCACPRQVQVHGMVLGFFPNLIVTPATAPSAAATVPQATAVPPTLPPSASECTVAPAWAALSAPSTAAATWQTHNLLSLLQHQLGC